MKPASTNNRMTGNDGEQDTTNTVRCIAHLDMDAFYASVELLTRPDLRGLPVAIGGRGNPNSRGVVTTATYEARAFGIHSGMALRKALDLCPECVFLPVNFDLYRQYSKRFKAAVREMVAIVEDRGIDEIYLDLSQVAGVEINGGLDLANRIRQAVVDHTGGLTCSIGIAPNKLIAKLASELNKPNGVAIVRADQVEEILWPLPARKINGIGPKANQKLLAIGIETIGDLAARNPDELIARFGQSYGRWLHAVAWGRDDRRVVTHSEPVSRSRETTFDHDMHPKHDWAALSGTLAKLAKQVAEELTERGYVGKTVGIKVRYADFKTLTRDITLNHHTNQISVVRQAAFECLGRIPARGRLRLIGVRVAGLSKRDSGGLSADTDRHQSNPQSPLLAREPYTPDLFGDDMGLDGPNGDSDGDEQN